jgi:hypothetical protein
MHASPAFSPAKVRCRLFCPPGWQYGERPTRMLPEESLVPVPAVAALSAARFQQPGASCAIRSAFVLPPQARQRVRPAPVR